MGQDFNGNIDRGIEILEESLTMITASNDQRLQQVNQSFI